MNDCLLILTVGTGTAGDHSDLAQGLINTLAKVRPRLFWLVPSDHPDSIVNADLVRESSPTSSWFQSWNTTTLYRSIPEPDDLFVCRSTLRQVIACARNFLERGERLLVNPTSGTKQMSVAATLAALDEEIGEITFTVGERHDGVVRTGTERLMTFSTEQFFRERALREAERLFQAGAYHGAALLLKQYGQGTRDAHDLAACLREWQRLNYKEARLIAAGTSTPALVKLRHHLIQLAHSPEESLLVLGDLMSSADDLLRWGDYEEALARYYRATELAAKLRLAEKHHLRKPYKLADLWDAAPSIKGILEAKARNGVCYLGLRQAMQVLQALDDRFADDYFADRKLGELRNLRNETVAGHGASAVFQHSVEDVSSRLRSFLRRHFPNLDQAINTSLRPRSLLGRGEPLQDFDPCASQQNNLNAAWMSEHRLKIRIGGQLSHFLDLRVPPGRDVDFLFHVSNSHAKVDPKFVTDNMQGVLAAHFGTDVEDGNERCSAREAVIDLGGGDLAYFRVRGIGVFSSSFQRARSKLDEILNAYRISEAPEKASFEIIKPGVGGTYSSRSIDLRHGRAQSENELRLHYGPDFLPWQELILSVMAKRCAGIHLLRGKPGTGKSSFIRHLVQVLKTSHRFYFLPSYEYVRVGNGALIEFLQDEQDDHPNLQFVIVMEDAEAVLMPRKIDTGFSVSALLNLTDGLLGEGLNLQFICTVNCEIAELDTAIVRPGRLRTARGFRLEAIALAEHCGLPIPRERREYSLAEIYNPDEASVNEMTARQVGFSAENQ